MTSERVAQIAAWLVAVYAVDVFVPIIDILGLPLPRYVASMSPSVVFIMAALGILIQMAWVRQIPVLSCAGIAMIGMLAFWSGLEVIGVIGRGPTRFDMILDFMPLFLVLAASHLHLRLFKDSYLLVSTLVLAASLLVLAHTVLLLFVSLGVQLPFISISELMGRNGMALLVPVCLWLLVFFPLKHWPVFGHRYILLLILALSNILLNSARAAFLILIWCVLVGVLLRRPLLRRWVRVLLFPAGLAVVVSVALSYPILIALSEYGFHFWGAGEDALSVFSRSQTNILLLDKLAQDPLLGIGWVEVAATRALGYMGHTLYVNVLAAYGVIGALAAIWVVAYGLLRTQGGSRETAGHLLFLAVLIASFSNNVFAYFGVVIALIEAVKVPNT